MNGEKYEIGLVGLGVMGRNLVLNIADHGFSVAGYDKNGKQVQALRAEAQGKKIRGAETEKEFLALLRSPRTVMLLVPAGPPVDAVIQDLLPHLEAGDLLVDCGNSHFKDTDRRARMLSTKNLHFLGVGVSGGESGARHGPSMMPGGPAEVYGRVQPVFEAIAAHVNGDPCVTHLGPGSAGHYVKMVHNGIEYGLMQLIAESYDLMRRGLGTTEEHLAGIYERWNETDLNSYLVEITARVLRQVDDQTGKLLVDLIRDEAKQKGTGKWTSQDAMDLQVPVPTIDAAVSMRDLSDFKSERTAAAAVLGTPTPSFRGDRERFLGEMARALWTAMVVTYAQGMALLQAASRAYGYGLRQEDVARIWRGGCIIRAALLEDFRRAYKEKPELPNLLTDAALAAKLRNRIPDLRTVVCAGAELGLPAPAMMASLAYYDGYRSSRLPANLTQAQRDYFGSHTYERIDREGVFHTHWGGA